MWDPVRPRNVKCGRNICHECFAPPMHRGSGGRDGAGKRRREENVTEGNGQVEKEQEKERQKDPPPPLDFSLVSSCFGRERGRDSRTRVFKCSSAVGRAACECTPWEHKILSPSTTWRFRQKKKKTQQSPSEPIYTASTYIHPTSLRSDVPYPLLTLNSYEPICCRYQEERISRIVSRRGNDATLSLVPKTDRTPQHIR